MHITFVAVFFFFVTVSSFAQHAHYLLLGANADLIKTDNDGFFEKLQGGVEANYFFSRKFTLSTGADLWTNDKVSWVIGARWYPINDAFFRVRGLIGEDDISIGGGWAKPLNPNLRVEAMADLYFAGHMAIRAGVAYALRRRGEE